MEVLKDSPQSLSMASEKWCPQNMTMTVHNACSLFPSQPFPPHFLHPRLQDGRTSHPICTEFHGGVCWMPGAGESREHPSIHALHDGELRWVEMIRERSGCYIRHYLEVSSLSYFWRGVVRRTKHNVSTVDFCSPPVSHSKQLAEPYSVSHSLHGGIPSWVVPGKLLFFQPVDAP